MTDDRAEAAARFLIAQRAPGAVLTETLPDDLRPRDAAEVIRTQLAHINALGPIGGWKVGARTVMSEPFASPLPASAIHSSPAQIPSRLRGVEAEISFRFGKALPPRDASYDELEVADAIETCQAAIEIIDPRFSDHTKLEPPVIQSDLGMHGGLVVGAPIGRWRTDMFTGMFVSLTIDGVLRRRDLASNPGGVNLLRLLVGLANSDVARAAGGIAAGAVVTTGSWTGLELVPAGGVAVAQFDKFPPVEVSFPA